MIPRARRRCQGGFTLLETMIATFVLVVGLLGARGHAGSGIGLDECLPIRIYRAAKGF